MSAVILVGHGSLEQGSGVAMLHLASLLSNEGIDTDVAFFNFTPPNLAEVVKKYINKGLNNIYIQPYFLIQGYFAKVALPKQLEEIKLEYPQVSFSMGQAFGYHPNFVKMVYERFVTTLPKASSKVDKHGLLLMAHGTPQENDNEPIWQVLNSVKTMPKVTAAQLSFMELNAPSIIEGADILVQQGVKHISAIPYFLQLGRHVKQDLPAAIEKAQQNHPHISFAISDYLSDEPLIEIIKYAMSNATNTS